MRIKRLTIRNLASIVEADIDFEHGLNDAVTGTPSSVFLISGDTGAGKSVILDAISLALYKTTPRVSGVSNVNNNMFVDSQGEQVRIGSIQQYSRIGIAPKDECYSELVFDGNDEKTYTAKLALGVYRGRATDGSKPFKYKTPEWTLEVDGHSYARDNDIKQKIHEAIGLSFDQFGRMAMLAQGQFAAFLTGDKKERESILEQLTNTEHFTAYGNAISSLFKKARDNESSCSKVYQSESQHTLPEEEVEKLNQEKQSLDDEKKGLETQIKALGDQIDLLELVETNQKAVGNANGALAKLEETMKAQDYLNQKSLVADWDATSTPRQRLKDLRKAEEGMKQLNQETSSLLTKFETLAGDLRHQEETDRQRNEAIDNDNDWLGERKAHDELFVKEGEYNLKLGQYQQLVGKITRETSKKQVFEGKVDGLAEALKAANQGLEKAENALDEKQKAIEGKTRERDALKPNEINKKLEELNASSSDLETLKGDICRFYTAKEEHGDLLAKIDADKKKLEGLNTVLGEKEELLKQATKAYEEANNRFVTMGSSLQETLVALRQRIQRDHVETCPLCGQGIQHELLSDEAFQQVLDPFEKEKDRLKTEKDAAEKTRDNAKSDCNLVLGGIKSKTEQANADRAKNEQEERRIKDVAAKLKLDMQQKYLPQIAALLEKNRTEVETLNAASKEAEALQKAINSLLDERKPLETEKTEAAKAQQKASQAVTDNDKEITTCKEAIAEAEKAKAELMSELSEMLNPAFPNWTAELEKTRSDLKTKADEYKAVKKRRDDNVKEAQKDEVLLDSLHGFEKEILGKMPAWNKEYPAVAFQPDGTVFGTDDVAKEWNALFKEVSDYLSEKTSLQRTIEDCGEVLRKYYVETGRDEAYLDSIMGREKELNDARKRVQETNDAVTSQKTTLKNAKDAIREALVKLNVADEEDLPEKKALEEKEKGLKDRNDTMMTRLGSIEGLLRQNKENQDKAAEALAALTKARDDLKRWNVLNSYFGGTRFRTLVQSYVLHPLLNNANIYLEQITDRYRLTCSNDNEQLSILVHDKYNKDQVRSVTILSGGERFMISLALSLALSSLNRPDMNVDILFIDEGFGTLDEKNLDSVMATLERLQEVAGLKERRVGIISHRTELEERIPVQIQVKKQGEGRSYVVIKNS